MRVRGLKGEEREAYTSYEDLRCWVCQGTIKAGMPYTRQRFPTTEVMTYPMCSACYPFLLDFEKEDTLPVKTVHMLRWGYDWGQYDTLALPTVKPSLLSSIWSYIRKVMQWLNLSA